MISADPSPLSLQSILAWLGPSIEKPEIGNEKLSENCVLKDRVKEVRWTGKSKPCILKLSDTAYQERLFRHLFQR